MKSSVVVIGGNHQNTLGVIRALGQKSVFPQVIIWGNIKKSYVLSSKYVAQGWICKTELEIINVLKQFNYKNKEKTIAIACCDDAACLLSAHKRELNGFLILPGTENEGGVVSWLNKEKMSEAAKGLGLIIPKSWMIFDGKIPDDICFPCVTKPITSEKNGKHGFSRCDNKEQLEQFFTTISPNTEIQIQEFIDKEFEFQLLGCSLEQDNRIIIPGQTIIKTTTGFNNLVFLKYDKLDPSQYEILEKTKSFVRLTRYSGLFSVEYMRGKDGKDYFLEMNFRNDGNGIAVTAAGTNLPYIWCLGASGCDVSEEISKSHVKTTYMMPEISFFLSMLQGEVSYKEYREDLKKTTVYLTYDKEDKAPFCVLFLQWFPKLLLLIALFCLKKIHLYDFFRKIKRKLS